MPAMCKTLSYPVLDRTALYYCLADMYSRLFQSQPAGIVVTVHLVPLKKYWLTTDKRVTMYVL